MQSFPIVLNRPLCTRNENTFSLRSRTVAVLAETSTDGLECDRDFRTAFEMDTNRRYHRQEVRMTVLCIRTVAQCSAHVCPVRGSGCRSLTTAEKAGAFFHIARTFPLVWCIAGGFSSIKVIFELNWGNHFAKDLSTAFLIHHWKFSSTSNPCMILIHRTKQSVTVEEHQM